MFSSIHKHNISKRQHRIARKEIKDVEILVPDKVVKVTFEDDTFEKAVCHPEDKFDMNIAISICLAKHLSGGSNKYNNIVNKAIKLYNNKCKAEEEAKKEKERIEAKRKKKHEKNGVVHWHFLYICSLFFCAFANRRRTTMAQHDYTDSYSWNLLLALFNGLC